MLIPIETAAKQVGVTVQTLETWAEQGLLAIQEQSSPCGADGPPKLQRLLDQDQLHQLTESLGWLKLSGEGWDNAED